MFGSIGFPEILLILVLALLIFGPKRLPEVGRTIGKGLAEFRRASSDLKRTVNAELALDEDEHTRTSRRPEAPKVLSGGAATAAAAPAPAQAPAASEAGEATEAADAAVVPKAAEDTTPRGMIAPEHPEVPDETFDPSAAPSSTEAAAPEAASSATTAPEAGPATESEDEPAATTH